MIAFAVVLIASVAIATSTTVGKLAEVNADFGFRMYDQIKSSQGVTDIFFSPISISTALGMLRLGAKSSTLDQISTSMKFNTLGNNQNQLFKDLNDMLYNTSNNYTLKSANKVFADQRFAVRDTFLNGTRDYFGAELEKLDFQGNPAAARTRINQWVEEKTEDKIEDLMSPSSITQQTVMVLANAVYFKGLWTQKFDRQLTSNATFRDGQNEFTVPMMTLADKRFNYAESSSLNCQILELPYAGSVSMFILLPTNTSGLDQLENQINVVNLNSLIGEMMSKKVNIFIPRFELKDLKLNLADYLKALGMTRMFTDTADLSGIGGNPGDLYVSSAVHKAFIKVDEEGTEAAAATGIGIGLTSVNTDPIPVFRADRPFMFFIRENSSGTILFFGRLKKTPASTSTTAQPTVGSGAGAFMNDKNQALFFVTAAVYLLASYWPFQK
ncbi:leukocyte elastase inhibitor-like [Lingula anatina]|uniref:Leukocyte elastase inhibitor-like n=1 Tax=Lingula anatina TaxID=7574 RepID=A0A1S3H6F9_LINAN|nr:leukocyte elastase inhibitor-like [Lingula anatina]XP_023933632.1 leukocyte elastase inhibitor-like [Lingula anatina]|eukprot:XP_013380714.1 leukocyte elastase inhibitor-like [Lingula anatina]